MKRIQLFVLIISLLFSLSALGHELVVKGMKLDTSNPSAGTYVRNDLNEATSEQESDSNNNDLYLCRQTRLS